jgi:ABC-2 type transport system permease protein
MRHTLRTLKCSVWLGWQISSNWTDPWLFVIYTLAKPLAGSLLLVFMFKAASATHPDVDPNLLSYFYLGSALFMVVGAVGFGMGGAVVADREHYGMLKYLRVSPARLQSYLIGRGLASGAEGMTGGLIVVVAGLLLGLWEPLAWGQIAWGWLAVYFALGVVMLLSLGLILAGVVLNMARHGMFLSEGVGSALYLLSGAVFPLEVLPVWLRVPGLLLPTTYWLEGMRRALTSPGTRLTLGNWQHAELSLALLAGTLALVVVGQFVFRWGERRAQRLGRFDQTTGF